LLASYHAERYPVGRFAARQSLTGPTAGLLRLEGEGSGLPPDEEESMFSLLVGYQYRSAAVVSSQGPEHSDAVSLVDELRGQPGTRLPHVWVQHGDRQVSTLDLVGRNFTLLAGEGGSRWADAAQSASETLGIPIAFHRIGATGDALDSDGSWVQATGLAPDGALLVRPDDFVGWRADALPSDPEGDLRQTVSAVLGRTDFAS
jgi:hypothetical protein